MYFKSINRNVFVFYKYLGLALNFIVLTDYVNIYEVCKLFEVINHAD